MALEKFTIQNFTQGLNLLLEERNEGYGEEGFFLRDCSNIEILKNGNIAKGNGYKKFYPSVLNHANAKCNGLHHYKKDDGSEYIIAAFGSKVYASNDGGTSFDEIYSGVNNTALFSFETFNDIAVFCNGYQILEYDGTTCQELSTWVDDDIPSLLKVHPSKNRLFASGSPDKPYRLWHSGIGSLVFTPDDVESTGTGTISTSESTTTTEGSGTVSTFPGGSPVTGVGKASVTSGQYTVIGSYGTKFRDDFVTGDQIKIGSEFRTVVAINNDTKLTVDEAFDNTYNGSAYSIVNPGGKTVRGSETFFLSHLRKGDILDIAGDQVTVTALISDGKVAVDTAINPSVTDVTYNIIKTDPGSTVIGVGTLFLAEIEVGDKIKVDNQEKEVTGVINDTKITVSSAFDPGISASEFTILKPNDNPGDAIDVNISDGQKITGLDVFSEFLIIHKEKSTFRLDGSTNASLGGTDPFSIVSVSSTTGCSAPQSTIAVKDTLLFINDFGISSLSLIDRVTAPIGTTIISGRLQPVIDKWNTILLDKAFALHHRNKKQIWFFIPKDQTSTTMDKILVLDYELEAWWIRDGISMSAAINYDGKLLAGGYDGYIYQLDVGADYDGSNIESYIELPWFSLDNNYTTNKQIQWVDITFQRLGEWEFYLQHAWNWDHYRNEREVSIAPAAPIGKWDLSNWDAASWGGRLIVTKRLTKGFGHGKATTIKIFNNTKDEPFIIKSLDIIYDTWGVHGSNYSHK